jgi:hypothetical protein
MAGEPGDDVLRLLKLAGLVRIRARRIKFALASASPYAGEWGLGRRPPSPTIA